MDVTAGERLVLCEQHIPEYFPTWVKALTSLPLAAALIQSPKMAGEGMAELVASWPWPEPDSDDAEDKAHFAFFHYRHTSRLEQLDLWLRQIEWPQCGESWIWLCQESPLLKCRNDIIPSLISEASSALPHNKHSDFSLAVVDVEGRFGLLLDTYVGYLPGDDSCNEGLVFEVTDWGLQP
ncbi:hypothetical protein ACFSJ3_01705 [Corallincola platygyrae]|uniref:Uncharacterized protein n=1 Tax=Corallincola platygyrae TaxID=1193278 RepID=A0ABW4XI31_9GAMM